MSEVWIIFIQIHKNDKKQFSKLLSTNCAGWNPKKLYKYKQCHFIIKMKERNWIKLKFNFFLSFWNESLQNLWNESPFKELFFLISTWLNYLGIIWQCNINTITKMLSKAVTWPAHRRAPPVWKYSVNFDCITHIYTYL